MSGRTSGHPEASVFPAQGPGGVLISEWTQQACILAIAQTGLECFFNESRGSDEGLPFRLQGIGHRSVPESISPHHILVLTLVVSSPGGVNGSPRHHGSLGLSWGTLSFF